ncbi:ThiF family adenylyltransferase [Nocardioides sp. SYSU DS0651]|uniref:ThiF family adenylyltransferase n=1 Tax=Nocardioides sp. SYSU DS0651 TaxID=3415955 RepID=UPI003F4BF13C
MTLAGADQAWSARTWVGEQARWCGSVRIVGPRLQVTWNDRLIPPPPQRESQVRTISAWGPQVQSSLARMRVLVVGVGSVGLDVAQRLAATGVRQLTVMDYDVVEPANLDRMIGATRRDAARRRPKVEVAHRLMYSAATADRPTIEALATSICSPEGLRAALDHDVIFSCVDRPWPRAVLNTVAYADLIPVIDGGISIDTLPGGGMRGASWRSHTVTPGRPCLTCTKQLAQQEVTLDMDGLLDDPEYIRRAGRARSAGSPNVAALSASVSAAVLAQFVSLVAAPAGRGVPGPLRYVLAPHALEHLPFETLPYCRFEARPGEGDTRVDLTRNEGPWTSRPLRPRSRRSAREHVEDLLERLANSYLGR